MNRTDGSPYSTIYKTDGLYRSELSDRTLESESFSDLYKELTKILPRTGANISVGSGTFVTDETLKIEYPLRLSGVGGGNTSAIHDMTIIKSSPDLDGPVVEVTGKDAPNGTMHGSGLVDLGIVGHKGGTQTDCLQLNGARSANLSNMFFESLLLDNADRDGFHVKKAKKHIHLDNSWIGHCNRNAMTIKDGYRYWLSNNYLYDSEHGLDARRGARDINVLFTHSRKNRKSGIKMDSDRYQIIGGRSVDNEIGDELYGDHGIVALKEYLNNQTGIQVGNESYGPENTQAFMNRFGEGLRGKHRTDEYINNQSKSKFRRFVDLKEKKGLGEATFETAKHVTELGKNALGDTEDKQAIGIRISKSATDTKLFGNDFDESQLNIVDHGTRTTTQNVGENQGDPRSEGDWRRNGREGIEVWDTENERLYKFIRGGWRKLS